jgi:gamma-glutamyltranspeptidase
MPANGRAKSLYGTRAAIVSGHHLATRAAEAALRQNGSLVDAMIAASAALTVGLPHTSSLGGCAMALFFDARTGTIQALNGSGRAPLAASADRFGGRLPQRGAAAALTPTLVRFWARAHERGGRLPWSCLFDHAIAMAEGGIGTPEELARNLLAADAGVRQQAGFANAFAPGGAWLRRGQLFRQPAIAGVLKEVAGQGENAFYRGRVAESLIRFHAGSGGLLTQGDLDGADADWVSPLHVVLGESTVYVMPPNSMGMVMLHQLALAQPGDDVVRQIVTAMAVIADAKDRIGDPSRSIDPLWQPPPGTALHRTVAEPADTTGVVAMDSEGNAVAMLQSVFQPFGSGCVDPGTGVLFNNRLSEFSLAPGHANELAPGMRPAHTLNPYLVTRQDAVHLAGVSPGGVSQTTTGVQILQHVLHTDASLGEITTRDRWSLGRDGSVLLEGGVPLDVAGRLRARGLKVVENSEHEFYFGSAKVIRRLTGSLLEAAADPRRQAHAAAW